MATTVKIYLHQEPEREGCQNLVESLIIEIIVHQRWVQGDQVPLYFRLMFLIKLPGS